MLILNKCYIVIILKFLNPTWIQLRDKSDQIVFSRLMNKNDEYIYNTFDNYTLTAGNAGNIIILLNNMEFLKKMTLFSFKN